MDPPAAELFAQRYRLGSVLGHGATALVYQAVDERLRRPVALKVFRPDADGDADASTSADLEQRFVTEARLLARLHHPGLVEIFDFGHLPQGPYLALELISGPTLHRLVAAGPVPFADTMRIGRSVAAALAYIHAAGVVHRDVKPSNILLDEHGLARLTDFGVSLAADAAGTTGVGDIVGTAAYLAPEQVLGARAGSAADVFALGLVLIECLTGRREYPGSPAESAVARLHRLPSVPQGLPRGVSRLLEQMTAWDPADRPDARACAAVFGRPGPGPVHPAPEPSVEHAVTAFGSDERTAWIQPAVTRLASSTQPAVMRSGSSTQPAVTRVASSTQPAVTCSASSTQPAVTRAASSTLPAVTRAVSSTQPAVTRSVSSTQPFGRRLSVALAAVAVLAAVGVAAIASGADAGSPAVRVPAVVAGPGPGPS